MQENNLAKVILRLDFEDIFKISPEVQKALFALALKKGFTQKDSEVSREVEFIHDLRALDLLPPKVLKEREVLIFKWNDKDGMNIALIKISPLFIIFEYNKPQEENYKVFGSKDYIEELPQNEGARVF